MADFGLNMVSSLLRTFKLRFWVKIPVQCVHLDCLNKFQGTRSDNKWPSGFVDITE